MLATLPVVLKIIDLAFTVLSFPWNMFIIVTNLMNWIKNKRLNVANQIIFGIGILNYIYGILGVYRGIYYIQTSYHLPYGYKGMAVYFVYSATVSCNLWYCTWLCVYFCLKIVNLNMQFYIYLQRKFHEKITCLLFLSVLVNFLQSAFTTWSKMGHFWVEPALGTLNHTALGKSTVNSIYSFSLPLSAVSYLVASLLFSSSALTIIISIVRHMKRVQVNTQDSRSPSFEAHVSAAKTVTSLLTLNILYVIFFLAGVLIKYNVELLFVFSLLVSMVSLFNSFSLIKGNKQLAKALNELLAFHSCSETSNNPAIV